MTKKMMKIVNNVIRDKDDQQTMERCIDRAIKIHEPRRDINYVDSATHQWRVPSYNLQIVKDTAQELFDLVTKI